MKDTSLDLWLVKNLNIYLGSFYGILIKLLMMWQYPFQNQSIGFFFFFFGEIINRILRAIWSYSKSWSGPRNKVALTRICTLVKCSFHDFLSINLSLSLYWLAKVIHSSFYFLASKSSNCFLRIITRYIGLIGACASTRSPICCCWHGFRERVINDQKYIPEGNGAGDK